MPRKGLHGSVYTPRVAPPFPGHPVRRGSLKAGAPGSGSRSRVWSKAAELNLEFFVGSYGFTCDGNLQFYSFGSSRASKDK